MMIETSFHILCADWDGAVPDAEIICEQAAAECLKDTDDDLALSIVLVDDAYIRALNRDYRSTDTATNVLAFCDEPSPTMPNLTVPGLTVPGLTVSDGGDPRNLGDVFVAFETTVAEARSNVPPISLAAHLKHLVVHGVLHLCGYDHENDEDATVMESREVEILSRLGVNNPYMDTEPQSEPQADPVVEQG